MHYVYDENGAPIGLNYRTNQYAANVFDVFYFEKNLQGDIVAVYNDSGTKLGTYTYDAWGNFTYSTTSGITALERNIVLNYNPFHYHGYYYDDDLGMYYLQSRYYNPQWGRFLNADGYISTGTGLFGYNMYAYCNNNPVNKIDSQGTWPRWITATVAVGSLIVCGASLVTGNVALAYGAWKVGAIATTALAIQSWHYDDRAKKNEGVPDTLVQALETNEEEIIEDVPADCHQFSSKNKKVAWKDGKEGIYDPSEKQVTDPRDIATYNYVVPDGLIGKIGHAFVDILPWIVFGNNDDDPGPLINYPLKWLTGG